MSSQPPGSWPPPSAWVPPGSPPPPPPSGSWPPPGSRPVSWPPVAGAHPTGRQLLSASWGLLRQDRQLLWLPAIAAVTGLLAAAILFGPGFALGWAVGGTENRSLGGWVGGVFAVFAASVVSIYFQAALVIGANERADGGDPTLSSVLAQAWTHRRRILSWAVLTTTVGAAIRALEQRLGILGSILGFLGGIAWAVASFLVVPVVIAEDLGPIAAVKRSAELIRQTWGTGLRTTLRFAVIQILLFLPILAVGVLGVVLIATGTVSGVGTGIVLVVAAVLALPALAMVMSAVSSYARALIYRYATGRPVPGIDPALFAGVFRARRRRGRYA